MISSTRGIRSSVIDMPEADVVVIDECHHARARTYEAIIEQYPDAQIVGLTATPCRGDGRGLGNSFDALVHCPSVRELIALGNLVPTVVYAPTRPDLKGVRVRQGDYVESELAARVDKAKLIGDIVEHWGKYAADRQTLAFAVGIQHSVHIRDEFRRAGVAAEHIDGSTPNDEREAILRGLANGSVRVVSNVGIATEGFDCPDVGAVVLARPTKSLGLYRQMVGRALRPTPGKENAVILDHAGAVFEHGLAEDDIDWTLSTDRRAENVSQAKRGGKGERRLVTCPECGAVRWSGPVCHACGYRPKPKPRGIDFVDGTLERVDGKGGSAPSPEEKRRWHAELRFIAEQRDYRRGWVAWKYKERFGEWPPRGYPPQPVEPSVEVLGWIRSRNIAYAKARNRNAQ